MCLFFDAFYLFYIFSDVIIILVFTPWLFLIILIFSLVAFVYNWDTYAPLKNWIPLSIIWMLLFTVQVVYTLYVLIIDR